jgi:sulfite exporter TauE/SafE
VIDLPWGLIVAAWLTGLAGGSGHCVAMCGGIAATLGMRGRTSGGLAQSIAAHLGRVLTYAAIGGAVGGLGATTVHVLAGNRGLSSLRLIAALLILAVGLQLLLGRSLLAPLERLGAGVWRRIAPPFRRGLPPRGPLGAFALGALWGWLPCGLVYAQLAVAAAAGGAAAGAMLMLAFGLGTSIGLGGLAALLRSVGLAHLPRQASGALLVLFAVWTLAPIWRGGLQTMLH